MSRNQSCVPKSWQRSFGSARSRASSARRAFFHQTHFSMKKQKCDGHNRKLLSYGFQNYII